MKDLLYKVRESLSKELDIQKLKEYWYVWFPWTNILFTLIATSIVGKVSLKQLLEFEAFNHILVFVLLLFFSITKSCLILRYSAIKEDKKLKLSSSVWTFIYHLFPSFFFIWTFYINWKSWVVVVLLFLDLFVCFSSNWLMKRKVYAHILADIVSLIFLGILIFCNVSIDNGISGFIFVILFVTLRYLLIESFYNGIQLKNLFSWKQKSGQFYWFSELLSTGIFLVTLIAITEELSKDVSLVVLLPVVFVYYLFLYFRLFLYKQYAISYKELYYFVTAGGGIFLYIWIINWINIDIIVWFVPAVIILVLDNLFIWGTKDMLIKWWN